MNLRYSGVPFFSCSLRSFLVSRPEVSPPIAAPSPAPRPALPPTIVRLMRPSQFPELHLSEPYALSDLLHDY